MLDEWAEILRLNELIRKYILTKTDVLPHWGLCTYFYCWF